MMNKINLINIQKYFDSSSYVLMVGLGFDSRCLSISSHFSLEKISQFIGISNIGWDDFNKKNISEFIKVTGDKGRVIGGDKSLVKLTEEITYFVENEITKREILIDITSFSHELIVVLMGILNRANIMDRVTLLYLGASEYSVNSFGDDIWLSRGVSSIRSVLGFPGMMLPSKKLHLIVLAGFEVERASEVIARYEPASLSIGVGKKEQSVSEEHHKNNEIFFKRLNDFVSQQDIYNSEVEHFDFSCVDPFLAKEQLLEHVDYLRKLGDNNIVICPLNTKLSTIGASLLAIDFPEIQICYAEPDEYNTEGYAKAGDEVIIVKL